VELREPEARDRTAFIERLASPEVNAYVGGPRQRADPEREMPEVPERWPGSFVVELDVGFAGVERLEAWDAEQWLGLRVSSPAVR